MNLRIVNRDNPLPEEYIPLDLQYINVPVDVVDEKKFMRYETLYYLRQMFKDAYYEECKLVAISGFRSYTRQKEIYEKSIRNKGEEYTKRYIAYPGTSEHQTGLALDISCKEINYELEDTFEETKEGKWLKSNVQKYGFVIRYPRDGEIITGYAYEPWHIRYIGREHSMAMYRMGIETLEEYLEQRYA